MRAFRALMAVLLFLCLLPMMSMAVAEFIAQIYGCKLDLASVHPCIVGGRDIGHDAADPRHDGLFPVRHHAWGGRHRRRG